MFKGKPLIKNEIGPDELFNNNEIDIIKNAVRRNDAETKGRKVKAELSERTLAGELLARARDRGFYVTGIKPDGTPQWACLAQPQNVRILTSECRYQTCPKCERQYAAVDYMRSGYQEECSDCGAKAKNQKINTNISRKVPNTSGKHKNYDDIPF